VAEPASSAPEFDPVGEARALFATVPWQRYVALGDSTTEGLGDPYPGYPDIGWPDMIAAGLRAVRPELDFFNLGKRFLVASEVRESQLTQALGHRPDLASVVVGGNDMLAEQFSGEAVEAEIEQIVAPLRAQGATVFTCTMFNIFAAGVLNEEATAFLEPRYVRLNEAVRRVADRHGLPLVDLANAEVSRRPEMYSKDLQHASRLGHAATAVLMLRELASAAEHLPEPHK
jgi:lysophospholipase L1-like esterase